MAVVWELASGGGKSCLVFSVLAPKISRCSRLKAVFRAATHRYEISYGRLIVTWL